MEFQQILKELREERELTQSEVAKHCGVSTQCISSLEMGTRKPTGTTLISLADFFNVSIDYLLGRTEDYKTISIPFETTYTKEEQQLINDYRSFSEPLKDMVKRTFATWKQSDINKKRNHS